MSNPATDYLNDFFADFNEPELLSSCCAVPALGELFKGFGRCSRCLEMAEFTKEESDGE